jgi:hypothetical protein
MSFRVPEKVLALARVVRDEGGRALMVGGCVRDSLMSIRPKDWDVEVYGVEPATLRKLLESFGRINVVGESFTVYKIGNHLDVSLPRRERKSGRGHRGFIIEGDPAMSLEEAARRRDFTINAILEDPLTDEIIDPFKGRADIQNKILRAVSRETFLEDSLRVLRAAQFAARFEFDIEPETIELCRAIDLTDLPRERIWGEMEKLLLRARRPSIGLKWLYSLGIVDQLFPELKALVGVPQEPEWHPEGWSIAELPFEPLVTSMAQAKSIDERPSLREFLTNATADPAVIPTGNRAMDAQIAETAPPPFITADSAGTCDFSATAMAHPTIHTPAESLVWSFGVSASTTDEVVRVMFKIPLNGMRSIVRGAVNDFEVVRGIVHPIAIFVMNMFPSLKLTTELQFHDNTVNPDGPTTTLKAGVHITVVVVDARATAIDGNVLFNFYLAIKRDSDFVHDSECAPEQHFFKVTVGDVSYHTELVVDRARELIDDLPYTKRVTVMLAALCHDFGKPATTEFIEGRWRSRGHEEAGIEPSLTFLERLNIRTLDGYDVRSQVVALVRDHLKPGEFYRTRDQIGDGAFRRLARRCELDLLYRVARADSLGRNAEWVPPEKRYDAVPQEWFIARARELEVQERPPAPILMGRHLLDMGLKPSPLMGHITRAVYEMQLDGRVRDLEEAKEAARQLIEAAQG